MIYQEKLQTVLHGHCALTPPPLWLMRQAGRYLPEYRKIREKFSDFIEFCLTPEAVTTVTLQPINRFDFDAAIIFSDILLIPHLLGQRVTFEKNHGPVLQTVVWETFLEKAETISLEPLLAPVMQAIKDVRAQLAREKSLIGFCGSPWTVATYMINGGKNTTFESTLAFATTQTHYMQRLLDLLTQNTIESLLCQIAAGCSVVQLFDSWASVVPGNKQEEWLWQPLGKIFQAIQQHAPGVPFIYYGKGVSTYYANLEQRFPNLCFGIDQHADFKKLTLKAPCQGNLDPQKLADGTFEKDVIELLVHNKETPFVFNLGHGILPTTPVDHVEKMIKLVRKND